MSGAVTGCEITGLEINFQNRDRRKWDIPGFRAQISAL